MKALRICLIGIGFLISANMLCSVFRIGHGYGVQPIYVAAFALVAFQVAEFFVILLSKNRVVCGIATILAGITIMFTGFTAFGALGAPAPQLLSILSLISMFLGQILFAACLCVGIMTMVITDKVNM